MVANVNGPSPEPSGWQVCGARYCARQGIVEQVLELDAVLGIVSFGEPTFNWFIEQLGQRLSLQPALQGIQPAHPIIFRSSPLICEHGFCVSNAETARRKARRQFSP